MIVIGPQSSGRTNRFHAIKVSDAMKSTAEGQAQVIYGSGSGLSSTGNQLWNQDSSGVPGIAEAYDAFGSALGVGNFGNSAESDLAIGIPLEDVGTAMNTGGVNVLFGTSAGVSGTGAQSWDQSISGVPGDAEAGDLFG